MTFFSLPQQCKLLLYKADCLFPLHRSPFQQPEGQRAHIKYGQDFSPPWVTRIPKNLTLLQTRAGQNAVSWREMAQPWTHGTPWTLEFGVISYFPLWDPSSPPTLKLLMKGVARNSPQDSKEPQLHWYLGNTQPESCPNWLLSTWYKLNHLRGENIKWKNASVGAVYASLGGSVSSVMIHVIWNIEGGATHG